MFIHLHIIIIVWRDEAMFFMCLLSANICRLVNYVTLYKLIYMYFILTETHGLFQFVFKKNLHHDYVMQLISCI